MKRYVLMYRKFKDDPEKRNKFYGGRISTPAPLDQAELFTKAMALAGITVWDIHSNPEVPRAPWNKEFGDYPLILCEVEMVVTKVGVADERDLEAPWGF